MTPHQHPTRRRVFQAIVAAGLVFLVVAGFSAVVTSSQSATTVAREFGEYREQTDARSARAVRDRKALARQVRDLRAQNRDLQAQIAALTAYLRKNGIEVPSATDSALRGSTDGQASTGGRTSRPRSSTSAPSTPAPSRPTPAPSPRPTPAPAPEPDPLLCIPVVGCLL